MGSSSAMSSVEAMVILTTLLQLARFAAGSMGPRFSSRRLLIPVVRLLRVINHNSVIYTLGLMRPPSSSSSDQTTWNDLFQVWAVLIVTMQDSVHIGRPYGTQRMTLIDLLSSLWSANLLREQTRLRLQVPLWLIWSVHASRVICYYVCNHRTAKAFCDKIKVVNDYMAAPQRALDDGACPRTMRGYRYIVAGEESMLHDDASSSGSAKTANRPPHDDDHHEELVTVEMVWEQQQAAAAHDDGDRLLDSDSRFKDVCLSFALYKLQRRRFFNFPIAEAAHPATRRLVSGAILEEEGPEPDGGGYDRALRVTEAELSFLHDFFYSNRAVVFSAGFPCVRLLLSLLMTVAASYLFHAVSDDVITAAIPTRGVVVTHCVIGVVVCRELMEVGVYALSQWTKVAIVCHYVRGRGQAQVARMLFSVMSRGRWDQRIRQYNLLMMPGIEWPMVGLLVPRRWDVRAWIPRRVKLESQVKDVLFKSLKDLMRVPLPSPPELVQAANNQLLSDYFRNAFGDRGSSSPLLVDQDPAGELEGDSHRILVWHIATSLCQINLLLLLEEEDKATGGRGDLYSLPAAATMPPHYVAAACLSNYCAYLVTQKLVPDNGLVAEEVLEDVRDEAHAALRGCSTIREARDKLLPPAAPANNAADGTKTIVGMGARLSETLLSAYGGDGRLWERLARFWAGFLLHLSASTRAAKHEIHLQGRGELTTHLWVLLSHAGFLGRTSHGHQLLDPVDLDDAS
ncbi:unnamed protein product [Urochloa decumbens]|uniref:DUF4220 domain-containing protein n=1 Tax=Urochloa decumbens TaxID=240449 RepID=A0ABC9ANC8_9POAL